MQCFLAVEHRSMVQSGCMHARNQLNWIEIIYWNDAENYAVGQSWNWYRVLNGAASAWIYTENEGMCIYARTFYIIRGRTENVIFHKSYHQRIVCYNILNWNAINLQSIGIHSRISNIIEQRQTDFAEIFEFFSKQYAK